MDAIVGSNALHTAFGYMAQGQREGNPMAAAQGILSDVQTSTSDMNALLKQNACISPGLLRFQQNMMLFALGKQGLRLSSTVGASLSDAKSVVSALPINKNQDYKRFLEDLVANQSRTWLYNRYVSGSVTDVSVIASDAAGRPSKLFGRYLFNARTQGSLTVEFNADYRNACTSSISRTPVEPRISESYRPLQTETIKSSCGLRPAIAHRLGEAIPGG